MKKLFVAVMGIVVAMAMTACVAEDNAGESSPEIRNQTVTGQTEDVINGETVQIPNPFRDCDTLEEAADLAGFELEVPEEIAGYENCMIQAIEDQMIQVIFYHEDPTGNAEVTKVFIRKGNGTEDISGDYNTYSEIDTVDAGDVSITVKGDEGKVYGAIWTAGEFSYAITFDEGVDVATVLTIAAQVR